MPDVMKDERKENYLKRAIPMMLKEGTAKDEAQAVAIANSMWEKHSKTKMMQAEMFQTTKDVFSVGDWNGDNYSEKDLDEMVKNFNNLKDSVKVPLKIDLFKKDIVADKRHGGMPACGWISDLKRVGKKLYAHIENIPKTIKELIDNKAYRQVSSEVTWNFQHNGERLRRVLTGVALLGVELPGVSNLDEFMKIYDKVDEIGEQKFYEYEIVKKLNKEEEDMDEAMVKEFEKQIADGRASILVIEKKYTDLLAKSETEKGDALKKLSEIETLKRKEDVKKFVEAQILDGKLLPVHKDTITMMFENLDISKVVKFKKDDKEEEKSMTVLFQDFISSLPKLIVVDPKSEEGQDLKTFTLKDVKVFGSEEGQKMDFEVKKYQESNKDVAYGDALRAVSKLHPELVG